VANLLANDFRVTPDAVPATLLDLAAHRLVEIEELDPGNYQCRLKPGAGATLAPYERRVLELLRARASGGVVPAQALTTGPAAESSRWKKAFVREVVADAQSRNLSRDLWDRRVLQLLAVPAAVAAGLLGLAFGARPLVVYGVGAMLLLSGIYSRRRQRDTPAGLEAASRWLGVREALAQDEVFPTVPPIGVALWERHLAYGAAFGLAAGAVRPIPMGAESDTRAWGAYGGRWHQVRISYPRVFPLGWGLHPAAALLRAVVLGAVTAAILYVLTAVAGPSRLEDADAVGRAFVVGAFALAILLGAAALSLLARSLTDLWSTTEVTGEVLRLRVFGSEDHERHYVAVDDGRATAIRAWLVRPQLFSPLQQYRLVTASVAPRLGYVRSISAVSSPVEALGQPSSTLVD
jgi:hypothetical protein